MNSKKLAEFIDHAWDSSIVDRLVAYVRIPNKSPMFEPEWERNGHMLAAANLMADWCRAQPIAGMKVDLRQIPGRTPLLFVDVPGELPGCVMLYGHLDKQPEFTGWHEGFGPWDPVIRDGKLYGRGAADDGYAVFSSLTAIAALKTQNIPLPRCVLLIEGSEESGSVDLPAHLEALGPAIADPSLIVCLDAECGNFDQLWCTTSLRGNIVGQLQVRVLEEGVHSGMATGIAPTPFLILQQLLARIESANGTVLLDALQVPIPHDRLAQIAAASQVLGTGIAGKLPWVKGAGPVSADPMELLINSTWKPTLAVTGADGLPAIGSAGNVLLPQITLKLSFRLPPTCDAAVASAALRSRLERDPPYGAQVRFEAGSAARGWNAPTFAPWLLQSLSRASAEIYGRDAIYSGSGGTIPFMSMLGERFPQAQFFVTGVLGPLSNAHGPNEFLHIDYAKKLTRCVSMVLADYATSL